MQNAALRVAVEHELFDYLLDNGKPGTEPITARQLMKRYGDPTLPKAMISKSFVDAIALGTLRGLKSPLSPYYEINRRYGLMQRGRQRLFGKYKDRSISFARNEERDQIRVCYSYLPGLMKTPQKLTTLRFDTHLPILANPVPYLQTIGFKSPDDSRTIYGSKENNAFRSPLEHTFGKPIFEWLEANPTYLDHCNAYMAARPPRRIHKLDRPPPSLPHPNQRSEARPLRRIYRRRRRGRGHDLTRLLATHPNPPGRAILQDLPRTIAENRRRGTTTPFEMMPHDFFTPQPIKGKLPRSPSSPATHPLPLLPPTHPRSPGARLYRLHAILHDFADASCLRILAHLAAAMTPGYSHLVVSEIVLLETGCALFPALMDLQMMVLCAGMERTQMQWRVLLGKAGLGGVRVYEGGGGGLFLL